MLCVNWSVRSRSEDNDGPEMDHTTWEASGHYLCAGRAGPSNTRAEDRVELVSLPFEQSSQDGPDCVVTLHFWAYKVGSGRLSLTARTSDEEEVQLWSSSPQESNGWRRARVSVSNSRTAAGGFILVLIATVAGDAERELAVDDIALSPECRLANR